MLNQSLLKWKVTLILMIVPILMLAGCQVEEEDEFDEALLIAVNNYVYEMSNALSDDLLLADLQGWVREYYEDDLPLRYDQERRSWLLEHRNNLEMLRDKHLDSNFPDISEIEEWEFVIVTEDSEWLMDGNEVVQALNDLDLIFFRVVGVIDMIEEEEGELDISGSERVLSLIEDIKPAVSEIQEVFFR